MSNIIYINPYRLASSAPVVTAPSGVYTNAVGGSSTGPSDATITLHFLDGLMNPVDITVADGNVVPITMLGIAMEGNHRVSATGEATGGSAATSWEWYHEPAGAEDPSTISTDQSSPDTTEDISLRLEVRPLGRAGVDLVQDIY